MNQTNDTPARRIRARAFCFAKHGAAPMTPEARRALTEALDDLGGEYAWASHGAYTGCPDCAGTEAHAQGVVRFSNQRSALVLETAIPGFKIEKLNGGPGGFAKYVNYLTHNGRHQLVSTVDADALMSRLPVAKAPTLREITRQVFEGQLTADAVADMHPDLYLRHTTKLKRAEAVGVDLRQRREDEARSLRMLAETEARAEKAKAEAEESARREARRLREEDEARRLREEDEARRLREEDEARRAWEASPEGQAELRELAEATARAEKAKAEAAAEAAAAEELFWAVATVAYGEGIAGRDVDRRLGLAELIGAEITIETLRDYHAEVNGVDDLDEEAARFKADCADTAHKISMSEWHAADDNPAAFAEALRLRIMCTRHPDLYGKIQEPEARLSKLQRQALHVASDCLDRPPHVDLVDLIAVEIGLKGTRGQRIAGVEKALGTSSSDRSALWLAWCAARGLDPAERWVDDPAGDDALGVERARRRAVDQFAIELAAARTVARTAVSKAQARRDLARWTPFPDLLGRVGVA